MAQSSALITISAGDQDNPANDMANWTNIKTAADTVETDQLVLNTLTQSIVNTTSSGINYTADQNANGITFSIDTEQTTTNIFDVQPTVLTTGTMIHADDADALTTGGFLNLVSNSSETDTRSLFYLKNDNALATGTTVMELVNDSTGVNLFLDQNEEGISLSIDSEATTANVIDLQPTLLTTGNMIDADDADALTTGGFINFVSNSADTGTRDLIYCKNDNTLATGATLLHLVQDSTGDAINCEGNITMGDGNTIGQSAGPLLTFDDSNNFLEITGCKVGIITTSPLYELHIRTGSGTGSIGLGLNGQLVLEDDGATTSSSVANDATSSSNVKLQVHTGSAEILALHCDTSGNVKSGGNGAYDLGTSANKWQDVWASNGTIQTSDINDKEEIENSALGIDFINNLKPKQWKWKDKTDISGKELKYKRKHHGLIGQEVKQVLDSMNIDTNDFAGYIYSEETGKCHLRLSEFIAPIIKSIKELTERIKVLENK